MLSSKNNFHYKIVIIGAGPAGSSCAIALARSGVDNILLIESGEHDKFRIGETVPPEIKTIFLRLNIYEAFLTEGHEPCYGSCSYWGNELRGYNDTLLSPYGHGWHLDRQRFNYFLSQQAEKAGAKLAVNSQFINSEQMENGKWKLTISDSAKNNLTVTADFVIDATGSRAMFAAQQGSKKINDEPLVCLGARFKINNNTQSISKQTHLEAAEYGWWYAARLPGDILLVTLYTDADVIKEMSLQKFDTWFKLLLETLHTGKLIHDMKNVDKKLKAFPAPSFRLNKITGRNWLALGDAASSFDPITSQGIIKSMSDALLAAEIITKHFSGEENKLEEYQQVVNKRYEQYLNMRKYFYRLENRWSSSPFWLKLQTEASIK